MKKAQLLFKNNRWSSFGKYEEMDNPLVLAFGNRFLLEDKEIYQAIRQKFPRGAIVLGTTSGEILHNQVHFDSLCVTAIEFEKSQYHIASHNIKDSGLDSRLAGRKVAEKLSKEGLRHVFVISEGTYVNGSDLAKGLQEEVGYKVTVTGGLCGDDTRFEKTLAGFNEPPKEGEIIVIGLYGEELSISFAIKGGWSPFGPNRKVTRSRGNVLYEIDNQPALDLYKRYLGEKANELPSAALIFPLNVREKGNAHSYVRTILSIDEDNNSMVLAGDIPEGATVQLMMTNMDSISMASEEAAQLAAEKLNQNADLAIMVSCIGRKLVLDQRVDEEPDEVKKTLDEETTICGFYSYGEIAPFEGERNCQLHNQTMTITLIGER